MSLLDSPRPAGQRAVGAHGDGKRERILRVAERLFFERGYAGTTIDQIVAELGMTKPFLYYYFNSKHDLFEAVTWPPARDCFGSMNFADDDARPAHEKIAVGIERLVRATVVHYPASFLPYRDPRAFRREYLVKQNKLARRFYDRLCVLMEQARADGTMTFGETRVTALAACSLPGYLYTWYRPDGRLSPDEVVRLLTELALRVLGARFATGAGAPASATAKQRRRK